MPVNLECSQASCPRLAKAAAAATCQGQPLLRAWLLAGASHCRSIFTISSLVMRAPPTALLQQLACLSSTRKVRPGLKHLCFTANLGFQRRLSLMPTSWSQLRAALNHRLRALSTASSGLISSSTAHFQGLLRPQAPLMPIQVCCHHSQEGPCLSCKDSRSTAQWQGPYLIACPSCLAPSP